MIVGSVGYNGIYWYFVSIQYIYIYILMYNEPNNKNRHIIHVPLRSLMWNQRDRKQYPQWMVANPAPVDGFVQRAVFA